MWQYSHGLWGNYFFQWTVEADRGRGVGLYARYGHRGEGRGRARNSGCPRMALLLRTAIHEVKQRLDRLNSPTTNSAC